MRISDWSSDVCSSDLTTHSPTQYSRSWATITGPSSRASALRSARARRLSALRVTLGPAIIGTVSPTDAQAHHSVTIASYAAEAFGDLTTRPVASERASADSTRPRRKSPIARGGSAVDYGLFGSIRGGWWPRLSV